MTFNEWLDAQQRLQVDGYDIVPGLLVGGDFAEYVRDNVLATTDELHEALRETRWKPWSRVQGVGNLFAFQEELVDAFFFVGNLLLVAGVGGDLLEHLYRNKLAKNYERLRAGNHGPMKGAAV